MNRNFAALFVICALIGAANAQFLPSSKPTPMNQAATQPNATRAATGGTAALMVQGKTKFQVSTYRVADGGGIAPPFDMFNVVGPAGHIAFSVARGETFSAGDWIWVELRDGKPFRVHYLGTDGVPFAGQEMDAPTVPVVSVENPLDKYRNAVRDYEETTLSPGAAASGGSGTQGSVKPDAQLKAKVTLDQVEKAARAKAAAKATSDTRARKDAEETKERARRDELDRIHADAVAASKPKMVYQVVDCKSFTPESLLFAACNSVDVDTWQRCTRTGQWNSADPSCSVN